MFYLVYFLIPVNAGCNKMKHTTTPLSWFLLAAVKHYSKCNICFELRHDFAMAIYTSTYFVRLANLERLLGIGIAAANNFLILLLFSSKCDNTECAHSMLRDDISRNKQYFFRK